MKPVTLIPAAIIMMVLHVSCVTSSKPAVLPQWAPERTGVVDDELFILAIALFADDAETSATWAHKDSLYLDVDEATFERVQHIWKYTRMWPRNAKIATLKPASSLRDTPEQIEGSVIAYHTNISLRGNVLILEGEAVLGPHKNRYSVKLVKEGDWWKHVRVKALESSIPTPAVIRMP